MKESGSILPSKAQRTMTFRFGSSLLASLNETDRKSENRVGKDSG